MIFQYCIQKKSFYGRRSWCCVNAIVRASPTAKGSTRNCAINKVRLSLMILTVLENLRKINIKNIEHNNKK